MRGREEGDQSQCLPRGPFLCWQEVVGVRGVREGRPGGGCCAGRLALHGAAGSERALWQAALVPGLPFVSWEVHLE